MPKAKAISLHPLTFHEAVQALVSVDPDSVGLTPKRRRKGKRGVTKASERPKTKSSPRT